MGGAVDNGSREAAPYASVAGGLLARRIIQQRDIHMWVPKYTPVGGGFTAAWVRKPPRCGAGAGLGEGALACLKRPSKSLKGASSEAPRTLEAATVASLLERAV